MVGQMLGDNALPEAVQQRRRKLRSRVMSLRSPIRSARESAVPGPDLIGKAENRVLAARDKLVSRDSVLNKISERRSSGSTDSGSSSSSSSNSGSSSDSSSTEMV